MHPDHAKKTISMRWQNKKERMLKRPRVMAADALYTHFLSLLRNVSNSTDILQHSAFLQAIKADFTIQPMGKNLN